MNIFNLEAFAETLKAKFSLPGPASPEDQLKPAVAELLERTGKIYNLTVKTRTETHLSEHKVRPDIAVYVGVGKLIYRCIARRWKIQVGDPAEGSIYKGRVA